MPLVEAVALGFLGAFLLLNMLYNYWKAILTSPGQPPEFPTAADELKAMGQNSRRPLGDPDDSDEDEENPHPKRQAGMNRA